MKGYETVAALLVIVPSSWAQPQTQGDVKFTLSWQEAHQGTNGWVNGALGNAVGGTAGQIDPGEGALFRVTIDMSGTAAGDGTGSPLTWAPSLLAGSSGAGSLSGYWSGDFDLVGDGGAATAGGTWSDSTMSYSVSVRRRLLNNWTAGAHIGTPDASGAMLTDVQPAQTGLDASSLTHGNHQVCFQALWIPSYATAESSHVVNWQVTLGSLALPAMVAALDNEYESGFHLPVPLTVQTNFSAGVVVPLVPAPGSVVLLGLGGVAAVRPRRRGRARRSCRE